MSLPRNGWWRPTFWSCSHCWSRTPLRTLVNSVGEPAVKDRKNHYADAVNRMDMDIAVVLDALKSSEKDGTTQLHTCVT